MDYFHGSGNWPVILYIQEMFEHWLYWKESEYHQNPLANITAKIEDYNGFVPLKISFSYPYELQALRVYILKGKAANKFAKEVMKFVILYSMVWRGLLVIEYAQYCKVNFANRLPYFCSVIQHQKHYFVNVFLLFDLAKFLETILILTNFLFCRPGAERPAVECRRGVP